MVFVQECAHQVEGPHFQGDAQKEGGVSQYKASFPKRERLRKKKEFDEVYKKGLCIRGEFLSFHILMGKEERKVGIVIDSKIKGGVKRNKVKRWIRECWRCNKYLLKEGFHLIIRAKKGAEEKDFWFLREEFFFLAKRGGILKA